MSICARLDMRPIRSSTVQEAIFCPSKAISLQQGKEAPLFADDKVRFTLQWITDSEEKCRVGQFLEKLGNKKSEIVVLALDEYLKAHPEVTTLGRKISITVQPTQTREQLQQMVRDIARAAVTELKAGMTLVPAAAEEGAEPAGPSQEIMDDMLGNLDFFK